MVRSNLLTLIIVAVSIVTIVTSLQMEVAECEPPDYPVWGGYGPRQDFYIAGDTIHYYCDTDTYIGGNFLRICEDNGDWTGDTPVCDAPAQFVTVNQTSTADPSDGNGADQATDGVRSSCTSTLSTEGQNWIAMLKDPGIMIRVMTFMPKGKLAYEVILLRRDGEELSCGTEISDNNLLRWKFHNCPGPNNRDAIGVKIKSLSPRSLQICEVVVHVLSPPTCVDPKLQIDNGRVQLTRKTASLVCDTGFTRSPASRIECIRDGVWNRKSLYCLERQWETGSERDHGAKDQNTPQDDP